MELKRESAMGQKRTLLLYPVYVRFRVQSGLYLGGVMSPLLANSGHGVVIFGYV